MLCTGGHVRNMLPKDENLQHTQENKAKNYQGGLKGVWAPLSANPAFGRIGELQIIR